MQNEMSLNFGGAGGGVQSSVSHETSTLEAADFNLLLILTVIRGYNRFEVF